MTWVARKPFTVFARGTSLRRRVAYSLGLVRLILVPVIFLAVYYLFAMGWIVDRIVSVDAPMATQAERISVEMLEARRAERNYFLLYDSAELDANRQALSRLQQIIASCLEIQPEERGALEHIRAEAQFYQQRMSGAVARRGEANEAPAQHIRDVIRAYTRDLNELLKNAGHTNRAKLVEELHNRVGSLDEQVASTLEAEDPAFRQISTDLRTSSDAIVQESSDLEARNWSRVQRDHERARLLLRRAEWVLSTVSFLTILLSVWVSFVLPREVVEPLVALKAAVDRAAAGNYAIEFDVEGQGEVVQLANSVRKLLAHFREKEENSKNSHAS
jgi:nitrogen fixation/metabolism regulation signal transduction histidine kinase